MTLKIINANETEQKISGMKRSRYGKGTDDTGIAYSDNKQNQCCVLLNNSKQ